MANISTSLNGSYDEVDQNDCDLQLTFSEADAKDVSYTRSEALLFNVLLPSVLALGLSSNIAFLYVVYHAKRMRTSINYCLVNLAVADVLFLLSSVVGKLVKYTRSPVAIDDSALGRSGCMLLYLISDTAYLFSLVAITSVSLLKFYAVCTPHRALTDSRRPMLVRLIGASWVGAFCVAATFIPCTSSYVVVCSAWPSLQSYSHWPERFAYCGPVGYWAILYGAGAQSVPFLLIFPLNVYLYYRIVSCINRVIDETSITGRKRYNIRQRNQISIMLIVNGIVFFVCLAPFEFTSLFYLVAMARGGTFLLGTDARQTLTFYARVLAYINAAINPLVYTLISTQYRNAFRKTFGLTGKRCGCDRSQSGRAGRDCAGGSGRNSEFLKRFRRISTTNTTASTSPGSSFKINHIVHVTSGKANN